MCIELAIEANPFYRCGLHFTNVPKEIHQYCSSDFNLNKSKMTVIEMRVHMDCPGCENKVKTALQKLKGVDSIEIDMSLQKVTVNGWADQKKVLKTVRKTGRRAELWQLPYTTDLQNQYFQQHHCNGPINYHASQPTSSYNYYKHGYDSSDPRYYHYPSQSSIFGHQTGATFSDDNPHACSIM